MYNVMYCKPPHATACGRTHAEAGRARPCSRVCSWATPACSHEAMQTLQRMRPSQRVQPRTTRRGGGKSRCRCGGGGMHTCAILELRKRSTRTSLFLLRPQEACSLDLSRLPFWRRVQKLLNLRFLLRSPCARAQIRTSLSSAMDHQLPAPDRSGGSGGNGGSSSGGATRSTAAVATNGDGGQGKGACRLSRPRLLHRAGALRASALGLGKPAKPATPSAYTRPVPASFPTMQTGRMTPHGGACRQRAVRRSTPTCWKR